MAAPNGGRSGTKNENMKAYLAVVAVRLIYAVMFVLSKVAFDGGMNSYIFVFYRQAFATLFLLPFALFYGWKSAPSLSFKTFWKIFLLAFVGITLSLDFNSIGIAYTTATIAAAGTNIIPVVTFFLAVIMRMELLKFRTISGIAKIAGVIACVGGVAVLALYQGPGFQIIPRGKEPIHSKHISHETHHTTISWLKGCFALLASESFFAAWIVFQVGILKLYPSMILFTTLQCALSTIQSFIVAIAFKRDLQSWKLGWNFRLLTVAYSGVMVTGVTYYLQSYVIEKKGPVFFSMTVPLSLIITVICSTLLLGEILTLGSVIGSILLVIGLYCVLWGKTKDPKLAERIEPMKMSEVDSDETELAEDVKANTKELYNKKKLSGGDSVV